MLCKRLDEKIYFTTQNNRDQFPGIGQFLFQKSWLTFFVKQNNVPMFETFSFIIEMEL